MSVGVYISILQPVTKEWLLEVCERYRYGLFIPNEGGGAKTEHPTNEQMPPPKDKPVRNNR